MQCIVDPDSALHYIAVHNAYIINTLHQPLFLSALMIIHDVFLRCVIKANIEKRTMSTIVKKKLIVIT